MPIAINQPAILHDVCRSILISTIANRSLKILELQNLPLTNDDIHLIGKVRNHLIFLFLSSIDNFKESSHGGLLVGAIGPPMAGADLTKCRCNCFMGLPFGLHLA